MYVLAAVAGDHDADVWLDLLDQKRGRGYSPAEVPGDAIPRAFCRASVHRWQGHAEGAANWQQTVDALQGLVTTPRAELLGVYAGL